MKFNVLMLIAFTVFSVAGCKEKANLEAPQQTNKAEVLPTPVAVASPNQTHPEPPHAAIPGGDPYSAGKNQGNPVSYGKSGKVMQIMNAGGYSYMEVTDKKGQKVWLAIQEIKVGVGDLIEYPDTPPLLNFKSKTLNRSFDKISFIPNLRIVKTLSE